MQVKDLVAVTKQWLMTIKSKPNHPDPFIQKESKDQLVEFESILKQLENSTEEITPRNEVAVKPILDFFANREKETSGFDAIIMHNRHTAMNEITWLVGLELSRQLSKDVYSIIAPKIKFIRNDPNLKSLPYPQPQQLVLDDTGECAVEVYRSIYQMGYSDDKRLKNTVLINGERQPLSEATADRVKNHSQKATALHKKAEETIDLKAKGLKRKVQEAQQQNHKDDFDVDHPLHVVTATYGTEAHARFAYKLIPNRDNLVEFLLEHPLDKWDQILNTFDLQNLRSMILNGINYRVVIAEKNNYSDNEAYNRAVLVMNLHLLRRGYQEREEAFTGSKLFGYDKTTKENQSNIPYDYLLSGKSLAGYKKYLSETPHSYALTWGDLGALNSQISVVADYSTKLEQEKRNITTLVA